MSRRIFYVVYFNEPWLQASLDAMRFIANPKEKSPAHVTIRGPYSQSYKLDRQQRIIRGIRILAEGVSAFILEHQNTVYIKCYAESLRKVWMKQDYGFNPHITIYDGESRDFAMLLLERLQKVDIRFEFSVDKMWPLESHKGQSSTWLRESFNEEFVSSVVGKPINTFEVDVMSFQMRIDLVETFARKLPRCSASR